MKNAKTAVQVIAGASKTPDYGPTSVKTLMKRLDMNERAFALLMNATPLTVRLWRPARRGPADWRAG